MFKALGKVFGALLTIITFGAYKASGKLNAIAEEMGENPDVIAGQYDAILDDMKERGNKFETALANLMAQETSMEERHKELTEAKWYKDAKIKMNNARTASNNRVKALQAEGKTLAEAKADTKVAAWKKKYGELVGKVKAHDLLIKSNEEQMTELGKAVKQQQEDYLEFRKEADQIAIDRDIDISTVISNQQMTKMNKMFTDTNLSTDKSSLANIKKRVGRVKAKGELSNLVRGRGHDDIDDELMGMGDLSQDDDFFSDADEADKTSSQAAGPAILDAKEEVVAETEAEFPE